MTIRPIAAALLILAAAAPANADELQTQLLAAARASKAEGLAFRRTVTIEATGQPRKVLVEAYDPRRAAADRWSLLTVDGRAPNAKELADAKKAKRGPIPSYARLAEWIGAPATRSEAGPGRVLYRYARLPKGVLKLNSHDASADTRAEALVNTTGRTPVIERVRMTVTKPFRMMLVASVQALTVDSRYRPLSDGTMVASDYDSTISGSMLSKSGTIRTRIDYAGFERVR